MLQYHDGSTCQLSESTFVMRIHKDLIVILVFIVHGSPRRIKNNDDLILTSVSRYQKMIYICEVSGSLLLNCY